MKREQGLTLAKAFKKKLQASGLPIRQVYLFGSVSRDQATEESDIDIAVVCLPFLSSKHDENVRFRRERWPIDLRIETVCLHPEDFENKYFTLAQEVKKHGISV